MCLYIKQYKFQTADEDIICWKVLEIIEANGGEKVITPFAFCPLTEDELNGKKLFKPEFINRIDEMIVFHMLGRDEIAQIVDIMVDGINHRIKEQMNLHIELDELAKADIIESGFDEKYGARPLKRLLKNQIEKDKQYVKRKYYD